MSSGENHFLKNLQVLLTPIHQEGYPFIAAFAGITLLLSFFSGFLGLVGSVLTLWCVYFFRDPVRTVPSREGLIISPADGKVINTAPAVPPAELNMGSDPLTRISIFMNVFNVHVNRIPVDGKISAIHYYPGAFFNASLDKASEENERNALKVTTHSGKEIGFVQIAGLVARRIVCYVKNGDPVEAGQRFGLIRFGSRVDVYLPKGIAPMVINGQTTVGGETVLADLSSAESEREGKDI